MSLDFNVIADFEKDVIKLLLYNKDIQLSRTNKLIKGSMNEEKNP